MDIIYEYNIKKHRKCIKGNKSTHFINIEKTNICLLRKNKVFFYLEDFHTVLFANQPFV